MNEDTRADSLGDFENYRISVTDGITRIRVLAVPGNDETLRMIRFLHDTNLYRRRLVDFREKTLPFSASDLIEFAAKGRALMRDRNRFALVIGDKTQRGPLEILAAYREQEGVSEVSVFEDDRAAVDWLSEPF